MAPCQAWQRMLVRVWASHSFAQAAIGAVDSMVNVPIISCGYNCAGTTPCSLSSQVSSVMYSATKHLASTSRWLSLAACGLARHIMRPKPLRLISPR